MQSSQALIILGLCPTRSNRTLLPGNLKISGFLEILNNTTLWRQALAQVKPAASQHWDVLAVDSNALPPSHKAIQWDIETNTPTEWDPENHFLFCLWNMSSQYSLLLLFKSMWSTFSSVTWSHKYIWNLFSRKLAFPVQRRFHQNFFFLSLRVGWNEKEAKSFTIKSYLKKRHCLSARMLGSEEHCQFSYI